jgi:hypothetical protein
MTEHQWQPDRRTEHAGERVRGVRCAACGQRGHRRHVYGRDGNPSQVVYTWEQHNLTGCTAARPAT